MRFRHEHTKDACGSGIVEAARVFENRNRDYTLMEILAAKPPPRDVAWLLLRRAGEDSEALRRLVVWATGLAEEVGLEFVVPETVDECKVLALATTRMKLATQHRSVVRQWQYDKLFEAFLSGERTGPLR